MLFTSLTLWAQAPQKMSYQAVVRDASEVLLTETTVGMQISILEGSPTGTPVYVETHTPTTNTNGLATLAVGEGSVVTGDFSMIDWGSDDYYIKSEIDPDGGTSYTIEGTSQLLSVPYALYAENGGSGNTLDQAYNKEMTTDPTPRVISVDDGKIELIADGHEALEITQSPTNVGLIVNGSGVTEAVFIGNVGAGEALEIINVGTADAVLIDNDSPDDGIHLVSEGGGDALDVENDGGGDAITIDNAGAGDALFIDNTDSAGSFAISVNNDGGSAAMDVLNDGGGAGIQLTNDGGGDGILVSQLGAGDAVEIDNDGGGTALLINNEENTAAQAALDIINDGGGDALTIDNAGAGDAIFVDNTDAVGSIAISVNNDGGGAAVDVLNTGGGDGVYLENTGAGKALNIMSGGTSVGVDILHGNPAGAGEALKVTHANDGTAVLIDNSGAGKGVSIFNGNPGGTGEAVEITQAGSGTGLVVDNGGSGKAAHFFNGEPGNDEVVLLGTTMGTGSVARFTIEDNNANTDAVLLANNNGAGPVAEFITSDEATGKVNVGPTVNVLSDGMGMGVKVEIANEFFGTDGNTEAALDVTHRGYGQVAHFENIDNATLATTVEIINRGAGKGLHIDSFGAVGGSEESLWVEQGNITGGAAIFDLHDAGNVSSAAVLIRSGATSASHTALVVIPADPTKMAASFEGDVDIASDLDVGGSFSAMAKAFKIDHPLDPTNKYLIHNSIESNERINIYSGNITTNEEGYATVQLPEYMNALNKDFKYQLTIVDKSFAQAIIWEEMNTESNSFVIKTNTPDITVSWQITGTRQDTWALENPMQVEVDKNSEF